MNLYERRFLNLNLSSPWVILHNKIDALFGDDPEIAIELDEEKPETIIRVSNQTKADALSKLLPESVKHGNVTQHIKVVPANEDDSPIELVRRAFAGNPRLFDIIYTNEMGLDASYVLFNPEIIQYHSDDLSSAFGISSTLAEDLCREILEVDGGVFFCTVPIDE